MPETWAPSRNHRRGRAHAIRPTVEGLEDRQLLATFTVTNTADAGPGSLRAAIEQANFDPTRDSIVFDRSVSGTVALSSPLPDLSTAMDIAGPGGSVLTVARSVLDSTPMFRIFTVPVGGEAAISGLTITGGLALTSGGGILNSGILAISNSVVSGNAARANFFGSAFGGGILNSGTLTIYNSTISNNQAVGYDDVQTSGAGSGGGISNSGAMLIFASTISNNLAQGGNGSRGGGAGSGGGISNSGVLTIIASTVSGNLAIAGLVNAFADGGGVFNAGTLTITISTLSGNTARSGRGGGIYNGDGNASVTGLGDASVTGSTFEGNIAFDGGEVFNSHGIQLAYVGGPYNPYIGPNSYGFIKVPAKVSLADSIFRTIANGTVVNDAGTVYSLGHNLFSDAPSLTLDPTDLLNTDPKLGPLADNGGPTFTHALLPGSPAIDAGVAIAGISTDQRGVKRPQGGAPDIGAFEDSATVPGSPTINALPTINWVRRTGRYLQPTQIQVNFSNPLDRATAKNKNNYRIVDLGLDGLMGTRDDRTIKVRSAALFPNAQTVTLKPARRLRFHHRYLLTVGAATPGGVSDTSGNLVDGNRDGQAGGDFKLILRGFSTRVVDTDAGHS